MINEISCLWGEDVDEQEGYWESSCGSSFIFNDGGPFENEFLFCPYCGKPILVRTSPEMPEVSS